MCNNTFNMVSIKSFYCPNSLCMLTLLTLYALHMPILVRILNDGLSSLMVYDASQVGSITAIGVFAVVSVSKTAFCSFVVDYVM